MRILSARSASILIAALAVQGCEAAAPSSTGAFSHAHVLATAAQSAMSWTPAQIRQAYDVPSDQTGLGRTQTYIIVAYHYPNAQSDFNHFCATYGLPPSTLTIINQAGTNVNGSWAIEEMTDIEMVHTVNTYTPITVIEAKSMSGSDIMVAIATANSLAQSGAVISMSFGADESGDDSAATDFAPRSGTTWIAASGDTVNPSFPATHPGVVAVGGTTLSAVSPRNESAWSSGGCGLSINMTKPAFQARVNASSYRAVPDVALLGNPSNGAQVYCSTEGGALAVGGTSVSTPLFAGIMGLVNASRMNAGKAPLSSVPSTNLQLQSALYGLLTTSSAQGQQGLYDITRGAGGCPTGATATTGYDIVTGIGSVTVAPLLMYLSGL